MRPASCQGHAIVDGQLQRHFPAVSTVIGAVFPVVHPVFPFIFSLDHRKAVLQTKFIRGIPQRLNGLGIAVILLPGLKTDRVDHKMGVNMVGIPMGSYHNFKTRDGRRQLHGDLVSGFRRDRFLRREGLHHVVVHSSAGLTVKALGVHELLQRNLGNAVDSGNQLASFVGGFCVPAAIGKDAMEALQVLGAGAVYDLYDGHQRHLLRFKISESKELTSA